MKTVLVTGFEPFAGEKRNPSAEIAGALDGRIISGRKVSGTVLPCQFGASIRELNRLLRLHRPELIVCLGQAGGRSEITPERVAINIDDARITDNVGAQPIDRPIFRCGPPAYWSTLPIKAIVGELQRHGIPAAVSQTAGTFVCNHVFYGLMHAIRRLRSVRGGFIHVPLLPQQAKLGQPSLPLDAMITGIGIALETTLRVRRDTRATGGATH